MDPIGAGEAACLAASLGWALSLAWFRAPVQQFGAWAANVGKNVLGTFFLGLTVLAFGFTSSLASAPPRALLLVAASGILGLALGDTALFAALARLGLHRTLLLQSLSPVFAGALAMGVYGERLTLVQLLGALTILIGIVAVVSERTAPPRRQGGVASGTATRVTHLPRRALFYGVFFGILSAFGQGAGLVLAKDGMRDLPFLPASFVRLGAAVLVLTLLLPLVGRGHVLRQLVSQPELWRRLSAPTFVGGYLCILLMMAGIAWAPASIAAVLLATPPVWALFLDAWIERRPVTVRGLSGTILTVIGIAVLTTS